MNEFKKADYNYKIDQFTKKFKVDIIDLNELIDRQIIGMSAQYQLYHKLLVSRGYKLTPTREYPKLYSKNELNEFGTKDSIYIYNIRKSQFGLQ